MTLSDEEVRDLHALLNWTFTSKPGIPVTTTLGNLWSQTLARTREMDEVKA